MKNSSEEKPEDQSWADTFLALGVILVSCTSGVFFGLYWRVLVLDHFITTDANLDILLYILYFPVGILGVTVGFVWFFVFYGLFKLLGIKVKDLPKSD